MHFHHQHDMGSLSIDQCAYRSRLRCWNTECKILFMLLAVVLNLLCNSIPVSLFTLLFMGLLSVAGGRIPLRCYLHAMAVPLAFIFLGALAVGIGFGGDPEGMVSLRLGFAYLYITRRGLWEMALVIAKALGAVSAMYVVTLSTPAGEFIGALQRLHLPILLVELMHLVYRYIFVLLEEQRNMRLAAQSRLGMVDFPTACRSFGSIMGNLLVVSLKKARMGYDAMESRCYEPGSGFHQQRNAVGAGQIACMAFYCLSVAGISLACSFLDGR